MGPRCRRKGASARTLARGPLGMLLRPTRGPGMGERCADRWGRAGGAGDASWAGRARLRWLASGAGGSVAEGGRRRASGRLGHWQVDRTVSGVCVVRARQAGHGGK